MTVPKMTVKELKEFLKDLPDSAEVVVSVGIQSGYAEYSEFVELDKDLIYYYPETPGSPGLLELGSKDF